jgi:hypothetical protein
MPRYAPLPNVSIDPRNEAELVQAAAQKVFEASNNTLNDFSAGNPLAALLEGQAFAQGEFLFWLNQLPPKVLTEWIGPFLGAMRRLGTPSTAQLVLTVNPSDTGIVIPAGTSFLTNPQATAGQSYLFFAQDGVTIPPGATTAKLVVYSQYVGTVYNVPANSITNSTGVNVAGLEVTNPLPAVGGSDVETFAQVQERFFTLIRRKNPVSETDWQDFFTDFYGEGTQTVVRLGESAEGSYNYLSDYMRTSGQVSLYALGPEGVELTPVQLQRGQNAVNFSTPLSYEAHLYPITVSQPQYNLTVEVDANGSFGGNFQESSLNFRDRLYSILVPGAVFPADIDPTVSDIESAFNNTFDASIRYSNPHVVTSLAYNTPSFLDVDTATYTHVKLFDSDPNLLQQYDLVQVDNPNPVFYPVTTGFTPVSSAKTDQPIYGNLQLKQIELLGPGEFSKGDVVYYNDGVTPGLRVVLESLTLTSSTEVSTAIATGKVSAVKTLSPWVVGDTYQYSNLSGVMDPDLVGYDYSAGEFIPDPNSLIPLNQRPGALVWLVSQNFTLAAPTNDLTGAQAQSLLGTSVNPSELTPGISYSAGDWVFTPQIGGGPNSIVDPNFYYVDGTQGVVCKYAYVNASFVCNPGTLTMKGYFDSLVEQGVLSEISVYNGTNGLPIFRYKSRFSVGEYLEYRTDAGLEPSYYIAAQFFAPTSTNAQDLVNAGLILPLYINSAQRAQFEAELAANNLKNPARMFTFFRGDRTYFRSGTNVRSYTATSSVTPLFDFGVYFKNGVFVESGDQSLTYFHTSDYIPYYKPSYADHAEDTIVDATNRNVYRVTKAFTPSATTTDWTGTTVDNDPRLEEYKGNLLRYVTEYTCSEAIQPQYDTNTSVIKLGVAQITMIPRNTGRVSNSQQNLIYVWEATKTLEEVPALSWFTGTTFAYNPPDYGLGTLAL